MAVFLSQTLFANFGSITSGGSFLFDCALISSIVAFSASVGLAANMSCQRLIVGSVIISALPPLISEITPIPSEWSAITTQSSGVPSLTGWPLVDTTCSPRAKRVASSGPSVVPEPPASADHPVCTCWSPK